MCRGPNTTTSINQFTHSHEISDPNDPRQHEIETRKKNLGCRINEAGGEYYSNLNKQKIEVEVEE